MDSTTFWEENGSVRIPVKFESCSSSDGGTAALQSCKEEQSLFQFCDGNLNFSTVATSEDDEFSFSKKKLSRDPMSHRIIEKRRRDRMNNCLADLSRLIPSDYLKKGRGRVEKTEIIEMAIKHMKYLQTRANKSAECSDSDQMGTHEDRTEVPLAPIDTEHYRLGYQECLSEAMHFMVEVEGFYAGDPLCVQLINHLQKHCDKILKGDRLNCPRAHVNETTSNSSASSGSYPPARPDHEDASRLRDMLTGPNLVSHNGRAPDRHVESASLYKFKDNIKQRFSAERRSEDDSPSKRRRFELELPRRHSDTCSVPSSSSPPPADPPSSVPIFALHAVGSYYVPLTLGADLLAPYFHELDLSDPEPPLSSPPLVLHPVTISVDFKRTAGLKTEPRPSRASSLLWKNDASGFVPLPNWFHADRHALTIPPYGKHV